MESKKQNRNWLIDFIIFVIFLILFFLEFTGVELHQWLGVAIFLLILAHLVLHQKWVVAVTNRFFSQIPARTRLYAILDGLLFAGFFMIVFTGLIISTWFNLYLTNYHSWFRVHVISSILTLVVAVVKISVHWRVIVQAISKLLSTTRQTRSQPVSIANKKLVSRRQFLVTMGVVSIGSLAAISQVSSKLRSYDLPEIETTTTLEPVVVSQPTATNAQATPTVPEATVTTVQQPSPTATKQPTVQVAQVCNVSCRKGRQCAYPGRCRDYRDANGNGLCDLGECM